LITEKKAEEAEKKIRVMCVVDGFNLYHSLDYFEGGVSPNDCLRYRKYRWLSLRKLALCFVRPKSEELEGVHYFTTYAHWDSNKVFKHRLYVRAQQSEGTEVVFGKFKNKQVKCKSTCGAMFSTWEEKQTDVNIARHIIESAYLDMFDRLILISGDSDQIPAIEFVKQYFPEKIITVVVPIGRTAIELKELAHTTEKMSEDHLKRSQFPEKVMVVTGENVLRPAGWK
jgi:uncharacterized LabA/DUF88 family protein